MRLMVLFTISLLIAGCSYLPRTLFPNRNKEFLAARSVPPLRIPPGLSTQAFKNEYPIPYRRYPEALKDVDLRPPGLS